jgi:transaldolase
MIMTDRLAELSRAGVSIWLDDLSRDRLTSYSDARQVLTELAAVGVDYDDVTAGLEQRGLELFDASWRELSDQLAAKLRNPCHS